MILLIDFKSAHNLLFIIFEMLLYCIKIKVYHLFYESFELELLLNKFFYFVLMFMVRLLLNFNHRLYLAYYAVVIYRKWMKIYLTQKLHMIFVFLFLISQHLFFIIFSSKVFTIWVLIWTLNAARIWVWWRWRWRRSRTYLLFFISF